MRRVIRERLPMLEDALSAAKRNPPKMNVVIDHLERAIDALRPAARSSRRDNSAGQHGCRPDTVPVRGTERPVGGQCTAPDPRAAPAKSR